MGEELKGNGIVSGSVGDTAAGEGADGTGGAEESPAEEDGGGGAEESEDEWGVDPGLGPGAPG